MLTGPHILQEIEAGNISISDFNKDNINPNSYDVTLGTTLRLYKDTYSRVTSHTGVDYLAPLFLSDGTSYLDPKRPRETEELAIPPEGLILWPGVMYLGHTEEAVYSEKYIPVLEGKSSIARLFMQIHMTAGFGDTGFNGQFTLEIATLYPCKVYPRMKIGQLSFTVPVGETLSYSKTGKYVGKDARGAVATKYHENFETSTKPKWYESKLESY